MPTILVGASLVTAERPTGDTISSPIVWIQYIKNMKITGVIPITPEPFIPATSDKNPKPAMATPTANFTGVEGFRFRLDNQTQSHATIGAKMKI